MKRKIIIHIVCVLFSVAATAQVTNPIVWLRADNVTTDNVWSDISGNGYDATFVTDSLKTADSLLNFNPAYYFSNTALSIPPVAVTEQANTVVVVYQADTVEQGEMPVWSFQVDSTHALALTTNRIANSGSTILYADSASPFRIVNSLTQLWRRHGMSDTLLCSGIVGANDSAFLTGRVAELLLLPGTEDFSDTSLYEWCSYLAVKYGVTLHGSPYMSSAGNVVWSDDSLPRFSDNVIGIGRDDFFGLHQKQSGMRDGMLTIGLGTIAETNALNGDTLADGSFLMVGCGADGFASSTELYLDNDLTVSRYGDGLVRSIGSDIQQKSTTLRVDASTWSDSLDGYVLLIDRSGSGEYLLENLEIFSPTEIDTARKTLVFSDVQWDTDNNGCDRFCFAQMTLMDLSSVIEQRGAVSEIGGDSGGTIGQYTLYPNPNGGHFVLEATYPTETPVTVRIYSADGKVVGTITRGRDYSHRIEGNISGKGQYLLEIISDEERNMVKMVVQ